MKKKKPKKEKKLLDRNSIEIRLLKSIVTDSENAIRFICKEEEEQDR